MPRQRFRCPRCHYTETLWYPTPVYDAAHNRLSSWPRCPDCTLDAVDMAVHHAAPELEVFPDTLMHDLLTGGTGLSVQDADGSSTTVSSLQEIRQIENRSLRRARNGEGQPIVFRGFSQSRQNMDRNTLAGSEFDKGKGPVPFKRTTERGLPIQGRVTTEADVSKRSA